MQVILRDDVVGLGDIGESVNVRPGYARNFLIPRGLAIETETANGRKVAHHMRQIEAKKRQMKGSAEERAATLRQATLTMDLRVGGNGRVFGSITARDVAAKLAEMGYELDRRRVLIAEPIRKLGEHVIRVKLHQEVETEIKIQVNPRESTKEEEATDVEKARQALVSGAEAIAEAAEKDAGE